MALWREVETAEGPMAVYEVAPAGPVRGMAIVLMEAFGLTQHIHDVCRRLADRGWRAMAPDLYHRTAPGRIFTEADMEEVMQHYRELTPERFLVDWDALASEFNGPVVSIGFCMGGRLSFIAACERAEQLSGAICCYGGGIERELDRLSDSVAPLQLIYGENDNLVPAQAREAAIQALDKAHCDYRVSVYPAGHGFLCPQRDSYDPASAEVAWGVIDEFMKGARGD